jgi:biopolymer transport protein ExbB
MKNYLSILFVLSLTFNTFIFAQDSEDEAVEVSTVEALLMLVKEGKTAEQTENSKREARFMANKNKQAEILAAEKRELARQERIADQLEAEYKKNEEILRVKEEAYQKELGSLVELFGHLQSSAGEAAVQFLRFFN